MDEHPLAIFVHCCGSCLFMNKMITASYEEPFCICLHRYKMGSKNTKSAKVLLYNLCGSYAKTNAFLQKGN